MARHSSEHHIERSRWALRCDVPGCTREQPFEVDDRPATTYMQAEQVIARAHEVAARSDWRVVPQADGDERHICPGPHTG